MYSESDVEDYQDYVSMDSSADISSAEIVEQQIALRDLNLGASFQSYAWTFDDEDGFFQSHFAHMLPDHAALPDRWDTPQSPDCFHAVSALLNAAAAANYTASAAAVSSGATTAAPRNADGEPAAAAGSYTPLPTDGKPSPASRFLCENFANCILIPVDKTLNRAQLREAHQDVTVNAVSDGAAEGGLDVVPGYRHTDAAGWALPITVDPAVLALLQARHPGWRRPTPADVSLFTKPERSSGRTNTSTTAAAAAAPPPAPSKRAWTRQVAQLMRSKERFLSCVAAAGGWAEVIFVAMDVEAFAVAAQSVPLPAEYAFEPVYWSGTRRALPHHGETPARKDEGEKEKAEEAEKGEAAAEATSGEGDGAAEHPSADAAPPLEKMLKPLHFFCHPGRLPEEEEPTILYNCLSTHLIPFRNATFLTHDYRTKLRQLDTHLVRNPRVVFINKGSAESPTVMDLQAIRWLYAAALWQQHRFCDVSKLTAAAAAAASAALASIPDAEDVHCFDVSVLEAAAADCSSRTPAQRSGEANEPPREGAKKKKQRPVQCCWYHTVAEDCEVVPDGVHCARRDAQVLVQRIRATLELERPGQAAQ